LFILKYLLNVYSISNHLFSIPFFNRYVKYLTKKYLNRNHLRDYVRVLCPNNDANAYILKYYKIMNNDDFNDSDMEQ